MPSTKWGRTFIVHLLFIFCIGIKETWALRPVHIFYSAGQEFRCAFTNTAKLYVYLSLIQLVDIDTPAFGISLAYQLISSKRKALELYSGAKAKSAIGVGT
jgi:hypothetical protein